MRNRANDFDFTDERDHDNSLRVYECECGAVAIAVAEEQAVDSYNSTFECTVHLPRKDAERLRDHLTSMLAAPPTVTRNHDRWHF